MLVLSRKVGERILVGDQIRITVVRVTGGGVRLGIEAPDGTTVVREELILKMREQQQADVQTTAPSKETCRAAESHSSVDVRPRPLRAKT